LINQSCRALALLCLLLCAFQIACNGQKTAPPEAVAKQTGDGGGIATLANSAVVAVAGGKVNAYEPGGQPRWSFDLPGGDKAVAAPAAAPNSVTYVRGAQWIFALSPEGQMLWQAKYADDNSQIKSIVALSDSTAVVTTGDTTLFCYTTTGEMRWNYTLPDNDRIVRPPAPAPNGFVHVRSQNRLYAINAEGKWQWQVDLPPASGAP
jgi:outer membrane protein assembly factor BamB